MEPNNKEIKRRSTFSLLFYINRTKVRKDGTCKLLCKVSIDAKSAPININAFVDPSLWNPETKRANGRSENARTVNLAIEKLTEKITGHYRHIRKSLGFVTAELVKNAVEGIGQKPFTLLALFREHNEEFRKRVGVDRKEETYESYENSYNILASFVKKRKEKEDVALRSLDREFYDDFEIFLRTDREMKPKTVHEHLYRLKKMTKRAVSQGTLRRDPYGKLHPELPRRKSRHLKLEDLKKLMETPVDKPDGMGGYNGGEIASSLAIKSAKNYIENNFAQADKDKESIIQLVASGLEYANMVVYEKSKENKELNGMGTTLDICLIYNNKAYIGHVGDSRIYRIRKDFIRKLTQDHSYVQKLVKDGKITEEEAAHHPQKNMLMKALRM